MTCVRCLKDLPDSAFYKDRRRLKGIGSTCKVCCKIANKKNYIRNKEAVKERKKIFRASDSGKYKVKLYKMYHNYGITEKQFSGLMDKQKGCCAICKESLDIPCIDHNHITGKVRGLLCHQCNRGVGLLKDSTLVLKNAIKYLEE